MYLSTNLPVLSHTSQPIMIYPEGSVSTANVAQ